MKFGQGAGWDAALQKAQQFQGKYATADQIPTSELPEQWDWRNVNGFDFTGQVRDQKACGSCYTFAFTQSAESRLKVKYGKEPPQLSP
jgi:cathepsin C